MNLWQLPTEANFSGVKYRHKSDYRQILRIFDILSDESRPELYRWYLALVYFYEDPIPKTLEGEAMAYLSSFLTCGDGGRPGPKLLDWQTDAPEIIADVNAVAGREIRAMEYLHWWSFLSFFMAIGEGRLSALVSIRDKLRRGKKLDPWEQEYYRRDPQKLRLHPQPTVADTAEKARLESLLAGN